MKMIAYIASIMIKRVTIMKNRSIIAIIKIQTWPVRKKETELTSKIFKIWYKNYNKDT